VGVPAGARTLYFSGINGYDRAGAELPATFAGQASQVWDHLEAILASAGMTFTDLVSIRFFLTSAEFDPENVEILRARLGRHVAARTVVVQQLLDPSWLIEVEAIAARTD
jgi:2-iminobutanoate/2-iminopropanoate deaminase